MNEIVSELNSPASDVEQKKVPVMKSALTKRKTMNMTTESPSRLLMRNFCFAGSGGGGCAHDETQSMHEHAGLMPCKAENVSNVPRHHRILTSTDSLHGMTRGLKGVNPSTFAADFCTR